MTSLCVAWSSVGLRPHIFRLRSLPSLDVVEKRRAAADLDLIDLPSKSGGDDGRNGGMTMRNSIMILATSAALCLAGCGDGGGSSSTIAPAPATGEAVSSVSSDGLPTMTKSMDFQSCLRTIQSMASEFGVAPTNIVETTEVRIVRFNTSDGSVLVTCSAADRKMVAVQSPHQG